tara:strand:+ start:1256 stop:1876 length:621 start_codon:yes stop_codon:yes gene_type:complete
MSIVKLNNNGIKNVTTIGSITPIGNMALIKKLTASSSSTLSFVNGSSDVVLDSTYKEYFFTFNNIHPQNHNASFEFQCSTDGGSNYNTTITSTCFIADHGEGGAGGSLGYYAARDQAQGTSFQHFMRDIGNENDESAAGRLTLYNPASTTFVKHFMADCSVYYEGDYEFNYIYSGYFNTTSAINAIQFKMASGNIDAGDICLYGIT